MLTGSCHCGQLRWQFKAEPVDATACNCTVCRRYGVLWAYGHEGEEIETSGETIAYAWGEKVIAFHFCPTCGGVGYWRSNLLRKTGQRRIAVNLRLADDPQAVAEIPVTRFDGLDSFASLGRDGRCVRDLWS